MRKQFLDHLGMFEMEKLRMPRNNCVCVCLCAHKGKKEAVFGLFLWGLDVKEWIGCVAGIHMLAASALPLLYV